MGRVTPAHSSLEIEEQELLNNAPDGFTGEFEHFDSVAGGMVFAVDEFGDIGGHEHAGTGRAREQIDKKRGAAQVDTNASGGDYSLDLGVVNVVVVEVVH